MNIFNKFIQFIKGEEKKMSVTDTLNNVEVQADAALTKTEAVIDEATALVNVANTVAPTAFGTEAADWLPKLKQLLLVAGHDVHAVWDDAVEVTDAIKVPGEDGAQKLGYVLVVAGHDVQNIWDKLTAFAKKH